MEAEVVTPEYLSEADRATVARGLQLLLTELAHRPGVVQRPAGFAELVRARDLLDRMQG